jgi:DNA repair protein RadC
MQKTDKTQWLRAPIYRALMVRDGTVRAPVEDETLDMPSKAATLLQQYSAGLPQEHFCVCCLNTRNRVIGVSTVYIGTVDELHIRPAEVFRPAITLNAKSIIVAHNHPSGDPTPSPEDVALTRTLGSAGEILGIELLDHIVVGDDRTYSLREYGRYEPPKNSYGGWNA